MDMALARSTSDPVEQLRLSYGQPYSLHAALGLQAERGRSDRDLELKPYLVLAVPSVWVHEVRPTNPIYAPSIEGSRRRVG